MQARYYDPVIGRFYSNDSVDAVSHLDTLSGIHGFNRYVYVNNNPYKYIDPDGNNPAALSRIVTPPPASTPKQDSSGNASPLPYITSGGRNSGRQDRFGNPVFNEASTDDNAAQDLPDLTGLDGAEAEGILGDSGFDKTKTTKGGYEQWDHQDVSQVWKLSESVLNVHK